MRDIPEFDRKRWQKVFNYAVESAQDAGSKAYLAVSNSRPCGILSFFDDIKSFYLDAICDIPQPNGKRVNYTGSTLFYQMFKLAEELKIKLIKLTDEKIKIVANIPYYITSPIIAHLLGEIDDLENKNRAKIVDIILMVQEEVARRITATEKSPAKQYGLLTILSQFWADCSIIRLVGRKSFYPAPKVNSALVSLKVRKEPLLKLGDYKHFRKTIKAAFSQRRKTLKNCLSGAGFDRDKVSRVIEKMGLDENIRGEKLSIKQLGELSENLCD